MAEPKVRFTQDDGASFPAWKTLLMSDVFVEITEKNHPEMPVLSVQQGVGTVLRDSSDRNILYDKSNLKNYKAMQKDDFIVHLRSFEGGLECSNYDGISSPAYRILRPKAILPAAYRDYFRSYDFIHNKLAVSVVGIRDGKNIDMETFWQIPISVPCLGEQQKIADLLSSVDEVITASEKEVANLETQKKAVMKKIFSQEVRFKRADGSDFPEWEEDSLNNLCDYVDYRGKTPEKADYGVFLVTAKNIRMGYIDYDASHEYIPEESYEEVMHRGKPLIGDVLFTTEAPCGMVAQVDRENIALAQRVIKYRTKNECNLNNTYLKYALMSDVFQTALAQKATGGTVKGIKGAVLHEMTIICPSDIEEQRLIADFLSDFDEAIASAKKELELWKELKKGLLQQMFV